MICPTTDLSAGWYLAKLQSAWNWRTSTRASLVLQHPDDKGAEELGSRGAREQDRLYYVPSAVLTFKLKQNEDAGEAGGFQTAVPTD